MAVSKNKAVSKSSSNKKKKITADSKPHKKRQGNLIFSLDIGTRTVVGIVGKEIDGAFHILEAVSIAHTKRAMIDGQIEEIDEVAKVVKQVKTELENRLNVNLSHVSIAAAGRALKTQHVKIDIEVPTNEPITAEMKKSFEIEAISQAQAEIDKLQKSEDVVAFYCVGHSVIGYLLDNYPIKSVVGHKGKKVTIEVIAAFLPSIVVESLYAVTDKNKLTVSSLTLEPIAAMNVIIPPEVRLINIALVDIGAGTSDIAVSRNGSIVAYAMATTAGDEITEEIITKYLVDFDTAEQMKLSSSEEIITFKDILGMEHTIQTGEFFKSIYPAIDVLAETIVQSIINVNGEAPAAIFLVGGGSQIPDLPYIIAKKLDIPEARVAVGGHNFIKNVAVGNSAVSGPEYVTPIGIAVTATMQSGYDFSTITLNDKKFRVFDTKNMTVLDLLMIAGYKTRQIIGHSGKNLSFTLNGEQMQFKGEISIPAQLSVNDKPAAVDSPVKHGDSVKITPATSGISAEVSVSDLAGDVSPKYVTLDGSLYEFGTSAVVNGNVVDSSYQIKSGDVVQITSISKLSELLSAISFDTENCKFQKGKGIISIEYFLCENDKITSVKTAPKAPEPAPVIPTPPPAEVIAPVEAPPVVQQVVHEQPKAVIVPEPQPVTVQTPSEPVRNTPAMRITLNGEEAFLPEKNDSSPHLFLEVLSLINIDLSKKQGTLIMTINGNNAQYTSRISENDVVNIFWG